MMAGYDNYRRDMFRLMERILDQREAALTTRLRTHAGRVPEQDRRAFLSAAVDSYRQGGTLDMDAR